MKKILFLLSTVLVLAACNSSEKPKTEENAEKAVGVAAKDAPQVKFEKEIYDFGTIKQGETVQYEFKFTNTGKSPLIISDASATCGCTVPEPPKEPIKPGDSGVIKVVFNSTGKEGMQDKVVTIVSNAIPEANKLHLVGDVKTK